MLSVRGFGLSAALTLTDRRKCAPQCNEASIVELTEICFIVHNTTTMADWPATRNRRESRDGLRVAEAETLEGPKNPGKWQQQLAHQHSKAAALSLSAGPASEASAGDRAHCPCPMT